MIRFTDDGCQVPPRRGRDPCAFRRWAIRRMDVPCRTASNISTTTAASAGLTTYVPGFVEERW